MSTRGPFYFAKTPKNVKKLANKKKKKSTKEVIYRELAKAIQELKDFKDKHNEDLTVSNQEYQEQIEKLLSKVSQEINLLIKKVDKRLSEVKDGKDGKDGEDGKDGGTPELPDIHKMVKEAVTEAVSGLPPAKDGKDGKDGKDAEITNKEIQSIIDIVYETILPLIPDSPEILDIKGEDIKKSLESLKKEDRLSKEAVQGIEEIEKRIKEIAEQISRVDSRFRMSGGGMSQSEVQTLIDTSGTDAFEKVSKNLKSYPATLNYTGSQLDSIDYTTPSGVITKTFSYTGSQLDSITLSGALPSDLTITIKTLSYTGTNLTGVAYS